MKNTWRIVFLICHFIGLLMLAGLCLMGCLYIFKDTLMYSVAISIALPLILFMLVYWVSGAKDFDVNKGFTLREGLGLTVYAALAVVSFFVVAHYINVDFLLRPGLQKSGRDKLEELTRMTDNYKTQVKYTNDLMAAGIDGHIRNYQSNPKYPAQDSLALYAMEGVEMADAEDMKGPILDGNLASVTKGLDSLIQANKAFNEIHTNIIDNWDRTRLHGMFKEMDDKLEANLSYLTQLFGRSRMKKWADYSFQFEVSARQDNLLSDTKALLQLPGYGVLQPVLVSLVVHLFILMPYISKKRKGSRRIYRRGDKGHYDGGIEI